MPRKGRRITIAQLKQEAQQTLRDAQCMLDRSEEAIDNVEAKAIESLDKILEGVALELQVGNRVLPVRLKVVPLTE